MREILILWATDAWHSYSSQRFQAVFTTKKALWKYLRAMKRAKELTEEDLEMLEKHNQTSGLEYNYRIEVVVPNPKYK